VNRSRFFCLWHCRSPIWLRALSLNLPTLPVAAGWRCSPKGTL
jgi:hypothetical protein